MLLRNFIDSLSLVTVKWAIRSINGVVYHRDTARTYLATPRSRAYHKDTVGNDWLPTSAPGIAPYRFPVYNGGSKTYRIKIGQVPMKHVTRRADFRGS